MRQYDRLPNETTKAYNAFSVYRDLGPDRSLAKAAEIFYGARKNLAQLGLWSRRYDWVARARAYDDHLELVARNAIEKHEAARAEEFAERRARLREGVLDAGEKALERMNKILEWPMSEQRLVQDGEDGEEISYIFMPSRWTLGTTKQLLDVVLVAAGEKVSSPSGEDGEWGIDPELVSEQSLNDYLALVEKMRQEQLEELHRRHGGGRHGPAIR